MLIDAPTDSFAVFYLLLNVGAVVLALLVIFISQGRQTTEIQSVSPLEVSQIAYLAGGSRRVIHSALASLAQRDAVRVIGGYIERKSVEYSANATAVEKAILQVLVSSAVTPGKLYCLCEVDQRDLRLQLQQAGLAASDELEFYTRFVAGTIAALPAIVGIIRLLHRLPQHRPIILLGVLCLIPAMSGTLIAAIPIYANRSGRVLLKSLRSEIPHLADIGYRRSLTLSPMEIGRAVALNGIRSLRSSHLSRLADLIDPPRADSDVGGDFGSSSDGGHSDGGFSGGDAF